MTVVIASENYPATPRTGDPIDGLEELAADPQGAYVLHSGTRLDAEGVVVSAGGRVLSVTALGDTLEEARARAYAAVDRVHLEGSHHRRDIGLRAARGEVTVPART